MNIDHSARQIMMAAFLYYGCNVSIMSDAEYDTISNNVADNWDILVPYYRELMESPEATRASGHHFLISNACYNGAIAWYKSVFDVLPDNLPPWHSDCEWDSGDGVTVPLMGMPG